MKFKKSELLTVILFCGFILIMALLYLLLPKKEFSENEKRFLPDFPELAWDAVAEGEWGEDIETYLAEHMPGRDFFVGLNAYFDLVTGRQASKDIWLKDSKLIEAPIERSESSIKANISAINNFSENIGQNIDLAIVPSAGWSMGLKEYLDLEIIEEIYSLTCENIDTISLTDIFADSPELYYSTDHHWTSEGAYLAYCRYMGHVGRDFTPASNFTIEIAPGFHGSTFSRSALWLTPSENIELWHGNVHITAENLETETINDGPFYYKRLEEADKYTVFLDGNHSIVRVHNPDKEGKLLVIRDSYSNCLGAFLAESYGEVVLVDPRYYKLPISELALTEEFDDILICYSIGNFMTDANICMIR